VFLGCRGVGIGRDPTNQRFGEKKSRAARGLEWVKIGQKKWQKVIELMRRDNW
jgi:hypothetical protein